MQFPDGYRWELFYLLAFPLQFANYTYIIEVNMLTK